MLARTQARKLDRKQHEKEVGRLQFLFCVKAFMNLDPWKKAAKIQNWGRFVEFVRPIFRLFLVPNVKFSPAFVMTFFSRGIHCHLLSDEFSTASFFFKKNLILFCLFSFAKKDLSN